MVQVHIAAAILALSLGPIIFLRTKGDRVHRALGIAFVAAMMVVNVSGLTIYDATGGPNLFHALAVLSLSTVAFGLVRARQGRIKAHLNLMGWAYAGLLIALATRLAPFIPLPFWTSTIMLIAISWVATFLLLRQATVRWSA